MKSEPGRFLTIFTLVLCSAVRAEQSAAESLAIEREGDAAWALGVPFYRLCIQAWERTLTRDHNRPVEERSFVERAGVALLLRDARLLELLRTGSGSRLKPEVTVPAPTLLWGDAVEPSRDSLDRLLRFLASLQRPPGRLPGRPEREVSLLYEAEAWSQRLRGEIHHRLADAAYERALSALGAPRQDALHAFRRGRLQYKLRSLAAAKTTLRTALESGQGLSKEEELEALGRLREISLLEGDLAAARSLAGEIRARSSTAEEPARPVARFQSLLPGSSVDLTEALQTLYSLITPRRLPSRPRAVFSFLLGDAALAVGENALADESLQDLDAGEDSWLRAEVAGRLGLARTLLGDYEAATVALEEARTLTNNLPGLADFRARVGINLARSLLGLGQFERAQREAIELLELKDLSAELRVRARVLSANALYEASRDQPEKLPDAQAAFQAAQRELELARKKDKELDWTEELEAIVAINLGNVARRQSLALTGDKATKRRKEAIALEERALRSAEAARLWPLAAVASANLGELHLESGDLPTAEGFVEWALARALEHRLFETQWRASWYRGRIAQARGQTARADSAYAEASAVIESYRSRILDAEQKSGFLTDKMDFYRDCVGREIHQGRPHLALAACERAKARALVDSLGWRFVALADPQESSLYREYVSLLSRSERAREGKTERLPGLDAKARSFDDLRARLVTLRRQITGNKEFGPALRALIDGDPSDVPAIITSIPQGATLIQYFALETNMVVIIGAEGALEAVKLPAESSEVDTLVSRYFRANAGDAQVAKRLYSLLLEPIEARIRGGNVIIVPFGSLHQLPFETLRDDRGYLIRRFAFSYLPSASMLRHVLKRPAAPGGGRLLAIVDPDTDYNRDGKPDMPPLPRTRDEVAGFSSYFEARRVLEGPGALKLVCQREAEAFDVIHYACHGEFYPTRPWESTLFLSPGIVDGVRDDGRLRASEVYALDLRKSRLVVLSGCETGRSQVRPGDDTVSIGTAFLHAGTPSLLVSLWKVEDEATAELMKSFYNHWIRGGKEKRLALRESKLELLARGYAHPRQWGAFVLVGGS